MSDSPSRAVNDAAARRRTKEALKAHRPNVGRGFSMMVHAYWQSPQYAKLSPRAVKLLVDLTAQYRGKNNGDLTTAWSVMQGVGWRSKHLLAMARRELEDRGWILRTRQGSIHAPTLYALTFEVINDCRDSKGNRKFDSGIVPNSSPLNLWKLPSYDRDLTGSKRRVKKTASPTAGKAFPESRGVVTPIRAELSR